MEGTDDGEPLAENQEVLGQEAALAASSKSGKSSTVKRLAISAAIAREVLTEAGHRCAVCGAEAPLEKAHIIPWRKVRRHDAKNLVCLCASCHQRADLEKWGETALQFYKENPWVQRSRNGYDGPPAQVRLTIDMAISDFDKKAQRLLQHAMARNRCLASVEGDRIVIPSLPPRTAPAALPRWPSQS